VQRHEDFNDDRKDAGDMGAGHTVTALFEVVPKGVEIEIPSVDPLEYQKTAQPIEASGNGEILHLKIRYKEPEGNMSRLLEMPVFNQAGSISEASPDFCFTSAVASFGMILRDYRTKENSTLDAVLQTAENSRGADVAGYREEFVELVRKARDLKPVP